MIQKSNEDSSCMWGLKAGPAIIITLIIIIAAIFFGSSLLSHMANIINPYIFNDDVRQYIIYFMNDELANSYIGQYYLNVIMPIGYKAIYYIFGIFLEPDYISKLLPYMLYFAMAGLVMRVSWKLGGWVAACFSLLFLLSSPVFFSVMIGGLPRSFGLPIITLFLYGCVFGRIYLLLLCTILGALFYPVIMVVCGLASAIFILLPQKYRKNTPDFSIKKRLIILTITAAICLLSIMPQLLAGQEYGQRLSFLDANKYPETGVGGRYGSAETQLHDNLAIEISTIGQRTLIGVGNSFIPQSWRIKAGEHIFWGALILCAIGIIFTKNIALIIMLSAIILAYFISILTFPLLYFPARYLLHTLPILLVILLPAGAVLIGRLLKNTYLDNLVFWLLISVIFFTLSTKINPRTGYTIQANDKQGIYNFISQLPENSIIAGWPTQIDNVSYLTQRNVFLSYETHQVLHEDYLLNMHQRMTDLIDAYLANDLEPIKKLYDKYAVTHLLIDYDIFTGKTIPQYFKPFDLLIKQKMQIAIKEKHKFTVLGDKLPIIYQQNNIILLDLTKL